MRPPYEVLFPEHAPARHKGPAPDQAPPYHVLFPDRRGTRYSECCDLLADLPPASRTCESGRWLAQDPRLYLTPSLCLPSLCSLRPAWPACGLDGPRMADSTAW